MAKYNAAIFATSTSAQFIFLLNSIVSTRRFMQHVCVPLEVWGVANTLLLLLVKLDLWRTCYRLAVSRLVTWSSDGYCGRRFHKIREHLYEKFLLLPLNVWFIGGGEGRCCYCRPSFDFDPMQTSATGFNTTIAKVVGV